MSGQFDPESGVPVTQHPDAGVAEESKTLYTRMLRLQGLATLAVTILAGLLAGQYAAYSALFGGVSVVLGAWCASRIVLKGQYKKEPTAVLLNLLKAEAVKIIVVAVFLFVVFKSFQALVPVALIAGLAASALFSGAALAKSQANI